MSHPEYAKLFTTYLELQRYQAIQEADPGDLELAGQSGSGENQEDSVSDKKDDWSRGMPAKRFATALRVSTLYPPHQDGKFFISALHNF